MGTGTRLVGAECLSIACLSMPLCAAVVLRKSAVVIVMVVCFVGIVCLYYRATSLPETSEPADLLCFPLTSVPPPPPLQAPPPIPTKASNGWGAPSSSSAPAPAPASASYGSYGGNGASANSSSARNGGGGSDSDRMAAIEAKLDKIMRHLGIS